jgi:hypothetical protein
MRHIPGWIRKITVISIIGILAVVALQGVSAEQNNKGNKNHDPNNKEIFNVPPMDFNSARNDIVPDMNATPPERPPKDGNAGKKDFTQNTNKNIFDKLKEKFKSLFS